MKNKSLPAAFRQLAVAMAISASFIVNSPDAYAALNPVDNGADTYSNPIIHADYSDPDVVRTGNDYWMVASSFNCFPGIPVLHSTDLINWEIVNHIYKRLPYDKYDRPAHGEGSWAPSIRYHNGLYYVYFCTPEDGLFVARAKDPRGDWELTKMLEVNKWEDPCPFWDEDGSAWLVHSIHRGGPAIIHRMSADGTRLLDNGTTVYRDTVENPVLEGMKMMKRDGWYYILAPAGGVSKGWQTILRSRSIMGPYESRRVLQAGDNGINGPHQGALVDTPDGKEWWFIHFQSKGIHGRVCHLQPARWTADGWLTAGEDPDGDGIGTPVLSHRRPSLPPSKPRAPQTDDDFNSPQLSLQWQWQAHEQSGWYSLTANPGHLRLNAISCPSEHGNLYYAGNLLLQKIPAQSFSATTVLAPHFTTEGERAGLIMMGTSYSYIAVIGGSASNSCRVAVVTGKYDKYAVTPIEKASAPVDCNNSIWLRVSIDEKDGDFCRYSYSTDGIEFKTLGEPCKVTPGMWIGAKTGIFCSTPNIISTPAYADFDSFTID